MIGDIGYHDPADPTTAYIVVRPVPDTEGAIPGAFEIRPCDGGPMSAADYPTLFAFIGYTYGGGDGIFHRPDLTKANLVAGNLQPLPNTVLP